MSPLLRLPSSDDGQTKPSPRDTKRSKKRKSTPREEIKVKKLEEDKKVLLECVTGVVKFFDRKERPEKEKEPTKDLSCLNAELKEWVLKPCVTVMKKMEPREGPSDVTTPAGNHGRHAPGFNS